MVVDGSSLALSSAMPGLAGAILQSRGALVAMRSTITHRGKKNQNAAQRGIFRLKLFNLLVREIGPIILEKGILLSKTEAIALLKENQEWFKNVLKSIHLSNHAKGWKTRSAAYKKTQWVV